MKNLQDKDFNALKSVNIEEFYGQLVPKEKKDFNDEHKRLEILRKMPEYRKLDEGYKTLIKVSNALSDSLYKTENELKSKLENASTQNAIFEVNRSNLFEKYNGCALVKDRFNKRNLLSHYENETSSLNEECSIVKSSDMISKCNSVDNMVNTLNDLIAHRTRIHVNSIKSEKLKEMIENTGAN